MSRLAFVASLLLAGALLAAEPAGPPPPAKLLSTRGVVNFSPGRTTNWTAAAVGRSLALHDRLRTLALSRASVQMQDFSVVKMDEQSTLEVLPPRQAGATAKFFFGRGRLYLLERNKPGEIELETPAAVAAIKGTEFHVAVEENGRTEITMIDGRVDLANAQGSVVLTNGEQGVVAPGAAPTKTRVIQTVNIIQWALYYPGVLDADELELPDAVKATFAASLASYRAGDLLDALNQYEAARGIAAAGTRLPAERAYAAGLLLTAGKVVEAEALLGGLPPGAPEGPALRWVLAAVRLEPDPALASPTNASQWLGWSYFLQSKYNLPSSLRAARAATEQSADFGFAWERLAEMQFGFARSRDAEHSLERALKLSPRNAQAHALKGFLLLARNRVADAFASFEEALRLDPALGNAWLGRGLCAIRRGDAAAGRVDMQQAASAEPNRWLLRSYLAKAYSIEARSERGEAGRDFVEKAAAELDLARREDPNDPTPWLYSALLHFEQNRINEAIRDLEQSIERNDNRAVYRSRLLLDQDRAVRQAKLATIYRAAGMEEVSLRTAARSVNADYANDSAHLFLADAFNDLRDPQRVNLRYETAWANEKLLSSLLTQSGGGALSRYVSQQEYSRLLDADGLHLTSSTEYFSHGDWRQTASQFGTIDRLSYSLDVNYEARRGYVPNADLELIEWFGTVKFKLGEQDSVMVQAKYQDLTSGDAIPSYDPASARPNLRFDEQQEPILLAGYQHEWAPGVQTLFLGGRLINDLSYTDKGITNTILSRSANGSVVTSSPFLYDLSYGNTFEIYTAELNQIFQTPRHLLVLGGRVNVGEFETKNILTNVSAGAAPIFKYPSEPVETTMQRESAYGYYTLRLWNELRLTAGLSYDHLRYPQNLRTVPVSARETETDLLAPKGALHWKVNPVLTVRSAYSQSLGGVSYDESVRLEPVQLAGFNQVFRSLSPEAATGSIAGQEFETLSGSLDFDFSADSKFQVQGEWLRSRVTRELGIFDFKFINGAFAIVPSGTPERVEYDERSLAVTYNQLLSTEWSGRLQYRLTDSQLTRRLTEVSPAVYPQGRSEEQALLQQFNAWLKYQHSSGLYSVAEMLYFIQNTDGYAPVRPREAFPQLNLYVGYVLPWQRGDVTLGVLNVTDQDYRLTPLSPYNELPRERMFYARFRFNF